MGLKSGKACVVGTVAFDAAMDPAGDQHGRHADNVETLGCIYRRNPNVARDRFPDGGMMEREIGRGSIVGCKMGMGSAPPLFVENTGHPGGNVCRCGL